MGEDAGRVHGVARRRFRWAAGLLAFASLAAGCRDAGDGTGAVAVIVEPRLAEPLRASLERFAADLEAEGFHALRVDSLPAEAEPERVRAALRSLRERHRDLVGAILVGEYGAPLANEPHWQGDPYLHDHLSDLYYMDLRGHWEDADGDGVLETHRSFPSERREAVARFLSRLPGVSLDRRQPEIWVSRLRAGTLPEVGDEVELLRAYFGRNHAFRTGRDRTPARAFSLSAGVRMERSEWGARPEALFEDVVALECPEPPIADTLLALFSAGGGWRLGIVGSFSGPGIHHLTIHEAEQFPDYYFQWPEGRRWITAYADSLHPGDVSWRDVRELQPAVSFWHILSSETGRHDRANYLAGAYVFSGAGLAAIAGTQHSGAIGSPELYDWLAQGLPVGEAWLRTLRYELAGEGKEFEVWWCDGVDRWIRGRDPYRAVLIGDGTLRILPEAREARR